MELGERTASPSDGDSAAASPTWSVDSPDESPARSWTAARSTSSFSISCANRGAETPSRPSFIFFSKA